MRHALFACSLLVAAAAGAVGAACSSESKQNANGGDAGADSAIPFPSGGGGGSEPTGPAGSGLLTGLPCDVQAVLENRCIACHDGANQVALLSYDNMIAPSKSDPAKTLAIVSLERMKSTTAPMPPLPAEAPAVDEIEVLEAWVNAGTPRGEKCTDTPPDGGVPDAGSPFLGDGGCTSGVMWNNANDESPLMNPGEACNACHQQMGGPNYRAGGTVYATLREPNDCNGKAPPPALTVVITDNNGKVTQIPVNTAGNFFTRTRLATPFRARVTDGTNTREMVGSVTSGDCNSCHTVDGLRGAPGRILAP